ncbi:MAG TPA: DUF2490 domain-containing protein [Chryseolinea sp.]|nr:DUF2490 domain-containing protein [Chryseolinea sp.]
MKILSRSFLLSFLMAIPLQLAHAQSPNHQLWYELMLNYSFAGSFNLENAFVYSTLLESPRWYAFDYTPTLDYSIDNHFDLIAGNTFSYTSQVSSYNTFEIRPFLGVRFNVTPNQRILTKILLRLEQRNFLNLDTHDWETVVRPRARAEAVIPINKKSYFEDKLWYGLIDAEWLFTVDDVEERFANRFRARIGIGYRLSYTTRFEFIYMAQHSKSGIDQDFESSDNIFRFRFKQYIRNKKKLSSTSTSGGVN